MNQDKNSVDQLKQFISIESQKYQDDYMFGDRSIALHEGAMQGTFATIGCGSNVAVTMLNTTTYHPIRLCARQEMPHVIEFGIVLSGNIHFQFDGCRREFDSLSGQSYANVYAGDIMSEAKISAGQRIQLLEIRLTPEALDQICHDLNMPLPDILRKTVTNGKNKPHKIATVANRTMRHLAQKILMAWDDEKSFRLTTISRELVASYLSFFSNRALPMSRTLSPSDIERIREARRLLVQDLENPPSLTKLAKLVTLNDFKLKLGFRQAFGITPYQYLKQKRLQTAYRLLSESRESITEIALAVGYGNLGDFGIAFKQKYGVTPTMVKR